MNTYEDFLQSKTFVDRPSGIPTEIAQVWKLPVALKGFQEAIVRWALIRGRAAIFAGTGLGKTLMQLSWADAVHQYTGNRVLILAPLCVAQQTVREAEKFGIGGVRYQREEMGATIETGVIVTNYEMLKNWVPWIEKGYFDGVVLDESSILKHETAKTRTALIKACEKIPYRLSCTATPSPNDYTELGNQSEFLGVMSMARMLACFFIRNGKIRLDAAEGMAEWRLKGHAKERFWEWLSHWACFIKKPSDLGFEDEGYNLPELRIHEVLVSTGKPVAQTMSERIVARRTTVDARVAAAAEIANASEDQFILWCHLNEESQKLASSVTGAVEICGADSLDTKESRIKDFSEGRVARVATKARIFGFGINAQFCHKMIFVGLNDSFEQLYQAVRRCWRFGQTHPVDVYLITADCEGATLQNIKRKEAAAEEMSDQMVRHMRDFCKREVVELRREVSGYEREVVQGDGFTLHLGDCVDIARDLVSDSIDYSVFSPPFASLFTYSNSDRDMGNCANHDVFWTQFEFLAKELIRVIRPGRLVSVHCCNLTATKTTDGYMGIKGFRDDVTRLFRRMGFNYHSEVQVWKDPVVEMQRTKAIGLLWKQIKKDSAYSRQGMPDYVLTFRKPGDNAKPIMHTPEEFPVKLWQQLASPCWFDIRQSNTLNRKLAREKSDERHICPLQLDLIERLLFLWSIPGDVVFSPFTGIGSEGYVARTMSRKFIGSELKRSYFEIAKKNLEQAASIKYQFPHFSSAVGEWRPGSPVHMTYSKPQSEADDPAQLDWIDDMPEAIPV